MFRESEYNTAGSLGQSILNNYVKMFISLTWIHRRSQIGSVLLCPDLGD